MTRYHRTAADVLLGLAEEHAANSSATKPTAASSATSTRESKVTNDPWKHRSAGMQCKTCMWYVEKFPAKEKMPVEGEEPRGIGRCRRHAPTMNGYPAVFTTDWCGDHKLDENRI